MWPYMVFLGSAPGSGSESLQGNKSAVSCSVKLKRKPHCSPAVIPGHDGASLVGLHRVTGLYFFSFSLKGSCVICWHRTPGRALNGNHNTSLCLKEETFPGVNMFSLEMSHKQLYTRTVESDANHLFVCTDCFQSQAGVGGSSWWLWSVAVFIWIRSSKRKY